MGRRALLTGGLALAAGAATLVPGAAASAATVGQAMVYAPAPSGGDDTAALQAALPAAGILHLPAGTYKIAGTLTIGNGQDIQGAGGGNGQSATILTCTKAGAGVVVSAGGGISGGLRVDGNSVATQPFLRNGGTGQWVGRTFQDMTVINSAQDGIVCLGSQNDAWYKVVSISHARDAWVIDQGYGGALFSRCEIASGGRYNLRLDTQVNGGPWPAPTDLVFHQCIVEYTTSSTVSVAYLNGAAAVKFDHTSFYASVQTSGPLVDLVGSSGVISFVDATFQSTDNTVGGTGLRVGSGSEASLTGTVQFQNLTYGVYVCSGSPVVDVKGQIVLTNCTNRYGADADQNVQSCIANTHGDVMVSQRSRATDFAYISANGGNGYYTFESSSGRKTWGSGADWTGDVALGRRTGGVLGVDENQLFASGYGTTASRPNVTPAMAGAIRFNTDTKQLEVTDGGIWYAPSLRSRQFFTSGTFVVPPGVTKLRCKAFGAGGGGGGGGNIGALSLATACYGGTGGGAGMMLDSELAVTPGDTLTVVVGAGGAGGAGAAASSGAVGNDGAAGTAGGATTVTDGSGRLLLSVNGGGGGPSGPGASLTAAIAPVGGGAYGCGGISYWVSGSGCGSWANFDALPAAGGVCGGASGAFSVPANGGGSGWAPVVIGQVAAAGVCSNTSVNGSDGASPTVPGCGGNGGGAGGKNGTGGAGGAGTAGLIEIWWVS